MQPIRVLASLLSLLWAGPAMAQSEAPITYRWAETASAEVAGQRLLGPLARLYPNYSGPFPNMSEGGRLGEVAFASRARVSGLDGMCEADVIRLSFEPDPETPWTAPADGRAETAPVIVSALRSETRFRATGDTALNHRPVSYWVELAAACAAQTDGWAFGMADNMNYAWFAARLQAVLPDMAEQEPAAFLALLQSCGGEDCGEPLVFADQLRRARFESVEGQPCEPFADIYGDHMFKGPYCLTARYSERKTSGDTAWLVVKARLEVEDFGFEPDILNVDLEREHLEPFVPFETLEPLKQLLE